MMIFHVITSKLYTRGADGPYIIGRAVRVNLTCNHSAQQGTTHLLNVTRSQAHGNVKKVRYDRYDTGARNCAIPCRICIIALTRKKGTANAVDVCVQ